MGKPIAESKCCLPAAISKSSLFILVGLKTWSSMADCLLKVFSLHAFPHAYWYNNKNIFVVTFEFYLKLFPHNIWVSHTTETNIRGGYIQLIWRREGCEVNILLFEALIAMRKQIGRAHVWTPVTWNDLVCRLLLEKKNKYLTYIPFFWLNIPKCSIHSRCST